ncbi:ABC transporter permease [Rhodobacter maris]|uniref:Transport permease protein n=1 Tax=Rhodobacter maris TaxID=446682 RepID=A0A285SEX5_9RHOB|nr:ABC transporter permease [Rhodobacter maris]SOC06444.1 capsular polysaccharide transport system permease protein [Rhodobacter maris]
MTQSAVPSPTPTAPPAQRARRYATLRTISALMLREMSTTYGRSMLGYLWAVLEPVAGIMLLTFIFSFAFRSPPLGTNFPLFYASGMLPFLVYMDTSQKIATAVRFSKSLLFYPGVTFIDAIAARFLINALTQVMVAFVVFSMILMIFDLNIILDPPAIMLSFSMAFAFGLGVGTLNCYLLSTYPLWERAWAVLNRPLFIISCIFFVYNSIPEPYRGYLWWNPIVHIIGAARKGFYATYDDSYVSPLYVFSVSGVTFALGLLLLRRYHRDIVNF